MRKLLIGIFTAIFLCMVGTVFWAIQQRGMVAAARDLMPDRWFQATLMDAYCGFITFYVWVCYKERSGIARGIWFVLIMTLGNIAMSAYVLRQLFKLPATAPLHELLLADSVPASQPSTSTANPSS